MNIEVVSKSEFLEIQKKLNEITESLSILEKNRLPLFLTGKELKAQLKCSDSTLTNYRNAGLLKFTKIGGRFYYQQEGLAKLFK